MKKKEAMKILKDFYDKSALFSIRTALDTVIPELTENGDEKIKREIIAIFKGEIPYTSEEDTKRYIAWIEKQSKKKSTDEVLKIRQEVYQSGYNDGYKHGQEDMANKEYVFRPVAGTMIENAVEQALKQGNVVLAFNGFYTPVKGKTSDEILREYDNWLKKQGKTFTKKDVDDAYLQGICDAKNEIEKQGEQSNGIIEPRKVYADKVISWLVANICDYDYYVKLFKKDFDL